MRSLASLLTAFSFVVMCLSGLVAFIMPQGRLAYWQMDPDASFKTVAAGLGVEPISLVQAILAGEPNLIAQKESASEQRRAK